MIFTSQTSCLFAQEIEQIAGVFWKGVERNDDEEIITNGTLLLNHIKKENEPFDSTIFEIRWFTAISLQKENRFNESLNIHLETLQLVEKKWGNNNLFYGLVSVIVGTIYLNMSKFDEALKYSMLAQEKCSESAGFDSYYSLLSLNKISEVYSEMGNYSKALEYSLRSYEITKAQGGNDKEMHVVSLNNLSVVSSNLGHYSKGLEYALMALDIQKENPILNESLMATTLNNVASSYSDIGDFIKALEYNKQALEIRGRIFGEESKDYASSLNNIASNNSNLGNYAVALEYNMRSMQIRENTVGKEHPDYALSLNNIASDYSDLGDFSKALDFNIQAMEIRKEILGKDHPDYALSLNNIASDYSDLGDFTKALQFNMEALEIRERVLGRSHPDYASSLSNIALCYVDLDLSLALKYSKEALEIRKQIFGENHLKYAISLNNMSTIFLKMGNFSEAMDLNNRSLQIKERALGKAHPDYALTLNNLSTDHLYLGNYSKALELQIQALHIYVITVGKEHSDYITCLSNMAQSYAYLGDYRKAFEVQMEVADFYERAGVKRSSDYALSLHNLASIYIGMKEYSTALEFNKRALNMRFEIFGKNVDYAKSLNNLAVNYMFMDDYSEALKCIESSLELELKLLGNVHPNCALTLVNLSSIHLYLRNYKSALSSCLRANEIYKLNQNFNYDYSINSRNLAFLEFERGKVQNARTYCIESYLSLERFFYNNRFGVSSGLVISSKKEVDNSFFVSCGLLSRVSSIADFTSRSWLNLNGIVGTEAANLESQIESSGDTALVHLMEDLKLNKKQLSKYRELTIEDKVNRGIDEKGLEEEVSKQERELSKQSKAFSDFNRRFNLKDVSSVLKGDEVFVDIARVPHYSIYTNQWTDSVKYLVFIHDAYDTLVDYRFIENGKELEGDIFTDYKIECTSQGNATDLKNALYYNSFWKPISEKIGSSKTIYVSLGGVYNNINLNTLYNPESGKYLAEERDIRIVNNARDFILSREQTERTYTSTSTALYGFPDYNGRETTTKDTTDYLAFTRDLDPIWLDSLTRGGLRASPLPATKVEVEQIANSFIQNGWQVREYLGDKASETNIKLEESPRVLHIATHGYFFEDIPVDKSANDRFLGMDRQRVVQDPMLRSGLLLTGANKTLQGDKVDGENGLLSASEASLLNLRGTELVVLSACETGRGEVKNSEGVYGLRKAFSDAGAANTIMSLWKVDDKVTQEFMTRFYEIWLEEQTTIREAFNRTQLEFKAKYPQPYYWGAFVLVG